MVDFSDLCETLIEEEGFHWLLPDIGRTRSTDWIAAIYSHHDKERQEKLAQGQAGTMAAACAACVLDFHARQAIKARKEELLKNPEVVEALSLFKNEGRAS